MLKDEACGKQIEEFVGLRAKMYSYKMHEDGKEEKKCNGVKQLVVRKTISREDYKNCLFSREEQMRRMNVISSHLHEMYSEEVNKVALSSEDDKRDVLEDKTDTLALGHHSLKS